MMFFGYAIEPEGLQAGKLAIQQAPSAFSARTIGASIIPHVRHTSAVWPHSTSQMAAQAAAGQLIFDAVRAGSVESVGASIGVPMWRRKP